jgi:hypothetical protein
MNFKVIALLICPLFFLFLLSTCTLPLVDTSTPAPIFAPTLFVYLTPSQSQEAFVPFYATAWTDTRLYTNPGDLFPEVAKIPGNTMVLVLGKSIGDEWIYIQLPSGEEGWTFAHWIQIHGGPGFLPTIQPDNAQLVIGRIVDEKDNPVNGVRMYIFRPMEDYTIGNLVTTDTNGFFYSFMPLDVNGKWLVSYDTLACNSNKMPPKCACPQRKCGQPYPQDATVRLPQKKPLLFTWK